MNLAESLIWEISYFSALWIHETCRYFHVEIRQMKYCGRWYNLFASFVSSVDAPLITLVGGRTFDHERLVAVSATRRLRGRSIIRSSRLLDLLGFISAMSGPFSTIKLIVSHNRRHGGVDVILHENRVFLCRVTFTTEFRLCHCTSSNFSRAGQFFYSVTV